MVVVQLHLHQIRANMYFVSIEDSIKDILLTPLGSRVMLPLYGSKIFELVDKKVDDIFKASFTLYVIEALSKWEKRVSLDEVTLISSKNGKLKFKITFTNYQDMELEL